MEAPSHLRDLNEAQRRAVLFGLVPDSPPAPTPPLLIIAGAGTGKTKTLAHRVAELLLRGADPRRILLLTFTRRAAETMKRRAALICAAALRDEARLAEGLVWSGTFHAMASRILRLWAERVGISPNFTVLDRGDAADLLDLVRHDAGLARIDRRFPKKSTCLAIYSYVVNAGMDLDTTLERQFPWAADWRVELRRLFKAYAAEKARQQVMDFDDLLLALERMLSVEALASEVGALFDHVLVDEVQDTNQLQGLILRHLKPDGRGLTVVGDDAQAIYGFRAATVRTVLDFPGWFTPPASIVALEQNYRSVQPILDAANAVMSRAQEAHPKRLWSERRSAQRPYLVHVPDGAAQVDYVTSRILEAREAGLTLADQAVLFRTSSHSVELEVELIRRNIPFVKFGGLKFLEAAHVKDVLAILRWAENALDEVAAFRTLQLLPGIGPSTARKLFRAMTERGRGFAGMAELRPPVAAGTAWQNLAALMAALVASAPLDGQIEQVRAFYDPLLPELHDNPAPRLADLDQLQLIAARFQSRSQLLTELALDPPETSSAEAGVPRKDEDTLTLSTIHSAKGQEWKAVYVLNCVDGCIPSDMATGTAAEIEEERRILYVAMTRAKDQLHLLVPERFYVLRQSARGDRHVRAARTRFIPADMLGLLERKVHVTGAMGPVTTTAPGDGPRIDLTAALKGMWG